MAKMHGKFLFTGIERVKGIFLFDIAYVHEIEEPFRRCDHALYVHIWPGKALVTGFWKKRRSTVDQHLIKAMGGRALGTVQERQRMEGQLLLESQEKSFQAQPHGIASVV